MVEMKTLFDKFGLVYDSGKIIFEENQDSMGMTLRYLAKAFGDEIEPSRRYCVFDGAL